MTLADWLQENPEIVVSFHRGQAIVPDTSRLSAVAVCDLFHLDDYAVSGRSAGCFWLAPRPVVGGPNSEKGKS